VYCLTLWTHCCVRVLNGNPKTCVWVCGCAGVGSDSLPLQAIMPLIKSCPPRLRESVLPPVVIPVMDAVVDLVSRDYATDAPTMGAGDAGAPRISDVGIQVLQLHGLPGDVAESIKVGVQCLSGAMRGYGGGGAWVCVCVWGGGGACVGTASGQAPMSTCFLCVPRVYPVCIPVNQNQFRGDTTRAVLDYTCGVAGADSNMADAARWVRWWVPCSSHLPYLSSTDRIFLPQL
jgi:hypothetical protein